MLTYAPGAWDLYFVYDAHLMWELKDMYTNGLQGITLQVRPFGQWSGVSEHWSDFQWGPDGAYINYVRGTAIMLLALGTKSEKFHFPAWLVSDLSGIPGQYLHKANPSARAIDSLRRSTMAAKQNRTGLNLSHSSSLRRTACLIFMDVNKVFLGLL